MRFKRHAKNGLRWVKGTAEEAETVVRNSFDYDSEGNSLLFELERAAEEDTEDVAGGVCLVGHRNGRPVWIQLLGADQNIAALDEAAKRFRLDALALRAGAQAAFAAPDCEITIHVGAQRAVGTEARAA